MKLRTVQEVADLFDVSEITVIRLADEGVLPSIELRRGKLRRMLRFRPEVVEQFLTDREIPVRK